MQPNTAPLETPNADPLYNYSKPQKLALNAVCVRSWAGAVGGGIGGGLGWRKGAGVYLPYPTGQFFGISPHIAKRLFFVHLRLFKAAFFI